MPLDRLDRREFFHLAVGGIIASTLLSPLVAQAVTPPRFKAIASTPSRSWIPDRSLGSRRRSFRVKGQS